VGARAERQVVGRGALCGQRQRWQRPRAATARAAEGAAAAKYTGIASSAAGRSLHSAAPGSGNPGRIRGACRSVIRVSPLRGGGVSAQVAADAGSAAAQPQATRPRGGRANGGDAAMARAADAAPAVPTVRPLASVPAPDDLATLAPSVKSRHSPMRRERLRPRASAAPTAPLEALPPAS